jgi:hypothetical protein
MAPRSDRGVALVIVLWMLVAMAIAGALVVAWSRQRLVDTQVARDAVQDRIDAIGTRDTLLFIAATSPMTLAGLPVEPPGPARLARRRLDEFGGLDVSPRGGELQLDGTVYAGLGVVRVQLQDEAGLLRRASRAAIACASSGRSTTTSMPTTCDGSTARSRGSTSAPACRRPRAACWCPRANCPACWAGMPCRRPCSIVSWRSRRRFTPAR